MSASNDLIGWVHGSPTGSIHLQETPSDGCKTIRKCPDVLPSATSSLAGGSGYDPRFQATWSSNGTTISLTSLRECKTLCRGTAVRILGANSQVSGLAVANRTSRLYQLETIAGAFAIVTYDISRPTAACFRPVDRCSGRTLTVRGTAAGLAYDEGRRLLYIATTEPSAIGNRHFILVTRAADPCKVLCRYQITGTCFSPTSFVTGLAHDGCRKILYATNQINNLEIAVGNPLRCQFRPGRCCPASGRYGGLAVLSGWSIQHKGRSCSLPTCPTCPNMHMTLSGGDPALGNPSFGINLVDAPAGGNAGLWLGLGCTTGFPYLCSTFYANPRLGPFVIPVSGSGCGGSARWALPLGVNTAFCGLKVCAQVMVTCRGPLPGLAISEAIEFTLTN